MPLWVVIVFFIIAGMLCDIVQIMPTALLALAVGSRYSGTAAGYSGVMNQIGVVGCAYLIGLILTYSSGKMCFIFAAASCFIASLILLTVKEVIE
jgi:predicted MFS family arabinose efflux permease